MHPDLSAPAANDRQERLNAAAEHRRVLRAIDHRPHRAAPALARQVLLSRWHRRWLTKDDCAVSLEHCSAKLIGHLE